MIGDFAESIRTMSNITPFSSLGVIGFALETGDDVTSTQTLLLKPLLCKIYISSNKLYFMKVGSTTSGLWSCPIATNTKYQCAILYDHNANASYDPVIYLNGVSQTVTEEATPSGIAADVAGILWMGGITDYESELFCGYIGDVWFYQGSLTAAQLIRATTNRIHGYALQFGSNIMHNWWMNEIPDGNEISSNNFAIKPDGNIATPWTTCSYTYINSFDDSKANADDGDDNEEFQVSCDTQTLTSGYRVIGCQICVEASGTAGKTLNVKYKVAGDGSYTSIGIITLTATDTVYLIRFFRYLNQTQIDGFEVGLLTGSISSGQNVYVDYVSVKGYETPYYCRDRRGNDNELVGMNAIGRASSWMGYQ